MAVWWLARNDPRLRPAPATPAVDPRSRPEPRTNAHVENSRPTLETRARDLRPAPFLDASLAAFLADMPAAPLLMITMVVSQKSLPAESHELLAHGNIS